MRYFLILLLIASLALSGYLAYQLYQLQQNDHVVVHFIRATPTNFLLVPVVRSVSAPASPEKALKQLLAGPTAAETELTPSVTSGTKLLGLTIENKTAIADFSKEIQTNFVGGSQLESHLVQAIAAALTQFPEIDRVRILIEGKPVESIAGHVYIDYDLP